MFPKNLLDLAFWMRLETACLSEEQRGKRKEGKEDEKRWKLSSLSLSFDEAHHRRSSPTTSTTAWPRNALVSFSVCARRDRVERCRVDRSRKRGRGRTMAAKRRESQWREQNGGDDDVFFEWKKSEEFFFFFSFAKTTLSRPLLSLFSLSSLSLSLSLSLSPPSSPTPR